MLNMRLRMTLVAILWPDLLFIDGGGGWPTEVRTHESDVKRQTRMGKTTASLSY